MACKLSLSEIRNANLVVYFHLQGIFFPILSFLASVNVLLSGGSLAESTYLGPVVLSIRLPHVF